jgi:hypothetical protein
MMAAFTIFGILMVGVFALIGVMYIVDMVMKGETAQEEKLGGR